MKASSLLLCLAACLVTSVSSADGQISATGSLFVTFDIGINEGLAGVLYARFVPDQVSAGQFPLMATGSQPGPVRYISFEAPDLRLSSLVGREEADRLSRDLHRVLAVPVSLFLSDLRAKVECDYPVYYATLVSVKSIGTYRVASRNNDAPIGC